VIFSHAEATGIAPSGATCLKLHELQEIVDPFYHAQDPLESRCSLPATKVPREHWVELARRHAEGESLRQLAKVYGVSHEAIRHLIRTTA
jgi:hypothetical protein